MALLPNSQENAMIQAALTPSTTYYLSLHSASPGNTGANELVGGSYARQAITLGSAVAGVMSSTNSQAFTSLPAEAGGVPFFGLWTAVSSGTYLGGGTVSGAPGPMSAGSSISFGTGTITTAATS